MPDDDTMLAQGTVDMRNEGRRAASQIAICAGDQFCQADADEHEPDCPIETQLLEEFGF